MTLAHFTKLGPGPFRVTDMVGPEDAAYGGINPFEGIEGDTGLCECCGKKISWRVVLRDANDNPHVVGRRCAQRASDLEGVSLRDAELRARRNLVTHWMHRETGAAFRSWCAKQPHPKGWKGKSLLHDLDYWCRGRTARTSGVTRLLAALKAFGENDVSALLDGAKRAQEHRLARKQERHAYYIRERLIEGMREGTPWEPLDWYAEEPEEIPRIRAKLVAKHGSEPDWAAMKAEIRAMTPAELWAEADRHNWIQNGKYRG